MDTLQKAFDKAVSELMESAKNEEELEKIADLIPDQIEETLAVLPDEVLSTIKKDAESGLAERKVLHDGFVKRNCERWKLGFDSLELMIELAAEAGENFNRRMRPEAVSNQDISFDVAVRLHAKGCLISKEILILLKNGYADGAHARWRALHEVAVTASFLAEHGEEAAKRYLEYELVEAYKGASQLNKYQGRLNAQGFEEEELEELKKDYDYIIGLYGKEFGKPYGWAQPFVPDGRVTFFCLEKAVGLDHWRPYYKWASQNVHANVKTIQSSLGMSEATEDMLQVGPSNSGMTDPAHSTAISLCQLTCTLLATSPNLDDLVSIKMIIALSDETGQNFLNVVQESI